MPRPFYIFLLLLLAGKLSGQSCTIRFSGQVLDRATLEPLEFTSVAIQEANRYMLSDSAGRYVIEDLCPGGQPR